MSTLTNGQLVILSNATRREDSAVDPPKHLKGEVLTKAIDPLLKRKLVKEIQAKPGMPMWRRDEKEDRSYALIITRVGRDAINIEPKNRTVKDADQHSVVTTTRRHSTEKIKTLSNDKKSARKTSAHSSAASAPRTGSKLALVVKMLGRSHGVSIDDLAKATDWLPHTTRAVITSLRNKGYRVETERNENKRTVYRIIAAGKAVSRSKAA